MAATWPGWSSAPEEVEHDDVAAGQEGDEPVVEVMVVGIAVHQHDRGLGSWLLTGVDPVRAAFDADRLGHLRSGHRWWHGTTLIAAGVARHR